MLSNKNFHRLLKFFPNVLWPLKILIIKKSLGKVGQNLKFGPNVTFYNRKEIFIGDDVFIGDGSTVAGNVQVTIGNNVMFGPEVMIRGGDHNFSYVGKPMRQVKEGGINLPINIEDDVWIGTRVIILKGVTIREGSVIGAGSIVNKDILPYSVSAGIPCKPIRCRFTRSDLEKHLIGVNSKYSLEEIISFYSNQNLEDLIV